MVPGILGHYRILRSIGEGGMGEVFLADDLTLGRRIALKVLPAPMAADPERRSRFDREARAVAALNHPNIVTIHSIEEQDGVAFLTMELVQGKTLDALIPPQGMTIEQWLGFAIPLTDAVGAAHQQGITHRDLKPANVMVSDEGRLKVLDFGLAKLADPAVDDLRTTMAAPQVTGTGQIVGTVAYMSPEQAQGIAVDARSDVFSIGILLYEMATGARPFTGSTNMAVLSAILKDSPASVTDVRPDLPRDLRRILKRCLAKDPDDRYQTARDLRNDLRTFEEDLAIEASDRRPASVHETAVSAPAAPRWRSILAVLAPLVLIGVVAGVWYIRRERPDAALTTGSMRLLTNTGAVNSAAISPDGRYVVHVDGTFGRPTLWMRQVSSRSSVQIVPAMAGDYDGLAFSPDGETVLYVFTPENGTLSSLFEIPVLGGVAPRRVVEDITTPPAFSPDGKQMAFIRTSTTGDENAIVVATRDGATQQRLRSHASPDTYAPSRVAWSPDGSLIAAFEGEMPYRRARLVLVDVHTGAEKALGDALFDVPGQLTWLPDGTAVVFDAAEQGGGRWGGNMQLWSVAYPAGTCRRLTTDLASYSSLTATASGRTFAAVRNDMHASLWLVPDGDAARAHPLSAVVNGREGATGIDWTSDGRIVYSATTQGSLDVWIARSDGTGQTPLTSDPGAEAHPEVLPDDQGIIYIQRQVGTAEFQVRAMDLDGSHQREIPTGAGVQPGYLQAIGQHAYFRALEGGRLVVYRAPLGGGPRERVLANSHALPPGFALRSVSRDEQWAAGEYADRVSAGMAVVPMTGSASARTYPATYTHGAGFGTTWAPDGRALETLVFRDGATNVWRFPLDGSAPQRVTAFTSEHVLFYRWSRDGKTLAVSRGAESGDVVLIARDDNAAGGAR